MIIYPSIDIKDGKCVRVLQGNLNDVVVVNDDPVQQAKQFEKQGFKWLHVIDLDGAQNGSAKNNPIVEKILKTVKVPVQYGGGLRTPEKIEGWIKKGVAHVVLGTMALKDPQTVRSLCRQYPDKIVISLDSRDGFVAIEGWSEQTEMKVLDAALQMEDAGAASIIYTDIDRDGAMLGLNIDTAVDLAWSIKAPLIVHGGASSMEELMQLKNEEESGIAGVICGSSLYDKRIDAAAALRLMEEA